MAYSGGLVYVANNDLASYYTPAGRAGSNLSAGKGGLTAIDVETGQILWSKKFDSLNVGAETVINDLVFTATYNGNIYAFKLGSNITTPQAMIIQPKDGSALSINDVNVSVKVQNFNLSGGSSNGNATGQGYINYFMDVPVPTTRGKPAVTAPGTYVQSQNTSYTWKNVSAWMHNFSIELVSGNNTPLYTDQSAMTRIFVGEVIQGVSSTVYTFTAPSKPGTYFFRCDVHPSTMTGQFIVNSDKRPLHPSRSRFA